MPSLADDDLLDFDHDRLAHFDLEEAKKQLVEQGEVYRSQLVAARWIEGWRERLEADESPVQSADWQEGYAQALREVTAHFRQGDLIPGGVLHEETNSGRL